MSLPERDLFFQKKDYELIFKGIQKLFPNLHVDERFVLQQHVKEILEHLAMRFNFTPDWRNDYVHYFLKDENDVLLLIISIIIPFINKTQQELASIYSIHHAVFSSRIYSNRSIDFFNKPLPTFTEYLQENTKLLKYSIDQCGNKLYVNWSTVRPITLSEYKSSDIYKRTVEYVMNRNTPQSKGLYEGDMYNTIALDMYVNVRRVKWLLYEIRQSDDRLVSYDDIIQHLFPSKTPDEYQDVLDKLKLNKPHKDIPYDVMLNVIKIALVYHDNYYNAPKGYDPLKKYESEEALDGSREDADYDPMDIPDAKIIQSFETIQAEQWFAYLSDVYRHFGYTWYSKKKHILEQLKLPSDTILDIPILLTRKNVYHFAKSFYMNNNKKWESICKHWEELDPERKQFILDQKIRFTDNLEFLSWLNINGYIRKTYPSIRLKPNTVPSGIEQRIGNSHSMNGIITYYIFRTIRENIVDTIFEAMIYKGVLTRIFPVSQTTKQVLQNSIDQYGDKAYYYITGTRFKEVDEGRYLQDLREGKRNDWTTMRAMNWVYQIHFYHKFIHNRVQYITGITGVGKSTETPKLMLYAFRMLMYRNQASIICTQPRIAPTIEIPSYVADALGVPIVSSEKYTNNYYIQYRHGDQETDGDTDGNDKTGGAPSAHVPKPNEIFTTFSLRMVTDGTLKEVLIKNFSLLKYNQKTQELTENPIYDMVVIDEAHEHNKNMDIILTFMKHIMKWNFIVKLAILSATMDNDEPRYRNFYGEINDKWVIPYPHIYQGIHHESVIDRRFHLSGSRHPVTETYLNQDTNTYPEAERQGIETVLKIVNRYEIGEILLFSIGKNEIETIVKELNTRLPLNVIAIPFHSKIPKNFKDVIKNIGKHLHLFLYDRQFITDLLNNEKGNAWKEMGYPYPLRRNTYSRAVIVATNVAEASITITGLRFVVDTGYARVKSFSIETGTDQLVIQPISESSRIQRKGRVGRRTPGMAYYMYTRGARGEVIDGKSPLVNENATFKICNESIFDDFLEMSVSASPCEGAQESKIRASYENVFKRYLSVFLHPLTPLPSRLFALTLDELLDFDFTYHIVHHDENEVIRDPYSGIVHRKNPKKTEMIYNFLRRHVIYKHVIRDDQMIRNMISVKKRLNNKSFTFYDVVALVVAYQMGVLVQVVNTYSSKETNTIETILRRAEIPRLLRVPLHFSISEKIAICKSLARPLMVSRSNHKNIMSGVQLLSPSETINSGYSYQQISKQGFPIDIEPIPAQYVSNMIMT